MSTDRQWDEWKGFRWNGLQLQYHNETVFEFTNPAYDKWYTDDKLVHCLGGYALTQHFDKYMSWWKAALLVQGCSVLWEIKDGCLSYKTVFWLGGDGFSYRDHIAVTVGSLMQYTCDHWLFRKTPFKMLKIYSTNNTIGFSYNF